MNRAEVLDTAKGYVTQDRASQHGEMENNFTNIEAAWSWWDGIKPENMPAGADCAIKMTLLKIARIASNPEHMDNWVDACGYMACGGEVVNNAGKKI